MRQSNRAIGSGFRAACLAGILLVGSFLSLPGDGPLARAQESEAKPTVQFGPGERFAFRIEWSPPLYLFFFPTMDAGRAEITLEGDVEYQNRKASRIVFIAKSSGALARLAGMNVDDRFEFLTDPETYCTWTITKHEREGKRKRDIFVVYSPEERSLHIRDLDVSVNPPAVKRDRVLENVPPCVRDAVSAAYFLRTKELSQGTRIQAVVGDNEKFKEIASQVVKKEKLDTIFGRADTWRIETDMSGLFRQGGHLKVWLSADARRIPLQFEARVPFGKVTGRLVEYVPGGIAGAGVDRKPNPVSPQP
jgi:hypothetical protein